MGIVKAIAIITGDKNVKGSLQFIQLSTGETQVKGRITGLDPGLHGFHIHALGDTTNGCNSTGPHFNPMKKDHGAPSDRERHAGDLGNIVAGPDGIAEISIRDSQIPLSGQHSILGRAVVVHADPDDLGRGGHELSKTTGNAGARVGCGKHFFFIFMSVCHSLLRFAEKICPLWYPCFGYFIFQLSVTMVDERVTTIEFTWLSDMPMSTHHWAAVICLDLKLALFAN